MGYDLVGDRRWKSGRKGWVLWSRSGWRHRGKTMYWPAQVGLASQLCLADEWSERWRKKLKKSEGSHLVCTKINWILRVGRCTYKYSNERGKVKLELALWSSNSWISRRSWLAWNGEKGVKLLVGNEKKNNVLLRVQCSSLSLRVRERGEGEREFIQWKKQGNEVE